MGNADVINNFFVNSVANNTNLPKQDLLEFYYNNTLPNIINPLDFVLSTENEIFNIIKNIKTKATGSDNINITLIHICCPYIIPYVTHIVHECILTSYFPTLCKHAQVVPLPKINNPTELSHLRSISILPTLSKVLERVLKNQIEHFLSINSILPAKQSGFRTDHGCESALYDVIDDLLTASNENKVSALILLDFSKTFDIINHSILLSILHYIGFSNNASKLIKSFLANRTKQVFSNQQHSSRLDVCLGVPQGGILGPLLYTIFTFNFYNSLRHCNYHLYADDTQIYYSFFEHNLDIVEEIINTDLNNFYDLATDHLLKLNPAKSTVILFGNNNQITNVKSNNQIKLNNIPLPFSESGKSLCLIMDSRFRFREHVTAKLRVAYGNLKLIYGNRHFLSQDIRKQLCDALVLSQFNHTISGYGRLA